MVLFDDTEEDLLASVLQRVDADRSSNRARNIRDKIQQHFTVGEYVLAASVHAGGALQADKCLGQTVACCRRH